MSYEVETEGFSGPLHLLLELVEGQELPVTEIALSRVTQQYLEYLEKEGVPSEHLADFLLVATRLLYLKSKELLPDLSEDEEESAGQLAGQLRLYQMFVKVAEEIQAGYHEAAVLFARPKAVLPAPEAPVWPEGLHAGLLEDAFQSVLKSVRPFLSLRQTTMERVRSVGERMEELRSMIGTRARMAFRDLTAGARSKMEVVVSFLALLELVKQSAVRTTQPQVFQDITIDRV